ncbi:hypothetical protein [Spiroplasma sp. ald]|uniref:hypothetical protein n=1 Tax=Spiroplasma sp. ald TaxID=2490849 RepID=UPI0037DD0723
MQEVYWIKKSTFIGGEAYNSVADVVSYQGPYLDDIKTKLEQKNIETKVENDCLIVKGKSSHGSLPERGINAALITLATYAELNNNSMIANFAKKNIYIIILILVIFSQIWKMKPDY